MIVIGGRRHREQHERVERMLRFSHRPPSSTAPLGDRHGGETRPRLAQFPRHAAGAGIGCALAYLPRCGCGRNRNNFGLAPLPHVQLPPISCCPISNTTSRGLPCHENAGATAAQHTPAREIISGMAQLVAAGDHVPDDQGWQAPWRGQGTSPMTFCQVSRHTTAGRKSAFLAPFRPWSVVRTLTGRGRNLSRQGRRSTGFETRSIDPRPYSPAARRRNSATDRLR